VSASTGPILAAGAVVIGNALIIHDKTWASQARTAVGIGVVAGGLALVDQLDPKVGRAFAWLVLIGVLFTRVDPNTPSPLESFASWWGVPGAPAGVASSKPFK
jgi:hypothetical protein